MSKLDISTNKRISITFRPSILTQEAIELYKLENKTTITRSIEDLIGYGVAVWLSKLYNNED